MNKLEGKKVTSVNPLVGAMGFLKQTSERVKGKDVSGRATAMTDKVGDITIDTCVPTDTNVWETGIHRESVEGKWVIVGQYVLDEEAKEGHQQWVELMKTEPTCELKDIDSWGIEDMS